MAEQSKEQQETVGRVMHEFKHHELKTSAGKQVTNPKQAIAIGLREAGASKSESDEKYEETLKRTKERERSGQTAKAEAEGGGKGSGKAASTSTSDKTKGEFYEEAKAKDVPGRSTMTRQELAKAVGNSGK